MTGQDEAPTEMDEPLEIKDETHIEGEAVDKVPAEDKEVREDDTGT
jgi:hypothetical protein